MQPQGVCVVGVVHEDADVVEDAERDLSESVRLVGCACCGLGGSGGSKCKVWRRFSAVVSGPPPCRQSAFVCHTADVSFTVKPLSTGQSTDVHGTLVVGVKCDVGVEAVPPATAHFKVMDSAVKVFPIGHGRV